MASLQTEKIVVPIDFSEESFSAVDTALGLAGSGENLTLVHVLEELSPAHPGELYGTIDDESRSKHSIEAINARFADDKYKGFQIAIVSGAPGVEIAEFAEKTDADLIVMPSSGRTGIARMLIGSVTERTIRLATCPVLVLRGKAS